MKKKVQPKQNEEQKVKLSPAEKFLKDLGYTNDSYLYSVILSGVTAAGGIGIAVLYNVTIGIFVAIAAVLMYMAFTKNTLYNSLGIAYTSESGKLTVTELYGKKREEVFIPSRLLYIDVYAIGDEAFDHASSAGIRTVHIPATVKVIGKDIFKRCDLLTTVYFQGSEEEFAAIDSETDFSCYEMIFSDPSVFEIPKEPKKEKKTKKQKKNGEAK